MSVSKKTFAGIAAILVAVLVAYFPALKIDFIVTDWWFLNNAARLDFLQHVVQYFDPRLQTYGFRPLQGFQFFFEYLLFRDDRAGFHFAHILFHTINCLLLLAIVWRVSNRWRLAFLSALAYATLPAYSLAVMWLGVADPITAIFFLLTILFWVLELQERRAIWYALAIGAFIMTMMGKEICVLLPPILFLIELLVLRVPFKFTDVVRRYAIFVGLLVPYLVYEYAVQRSGAFVQMAGYGIGPHVLSNLVKYLAVFVAPWLLFPPTEGFYYAWLVLALGLFLYVVVRTRSRVLLFLGLAPLLVVLPVLGFEPFWFDARYLYLPLMAGAVLLALVIERAGRWLNKVPLARWILALGLGGLLVANSLIIANSAGDWTEITRQRRVPFRDISRAHPTFPANTYLYFLESKPVPLFDLSVMFVLKYGTNPVVEGIDRNQMPRWRDFSSAFLYYYDETGKPVEIAIAPARFDTSPALPIDFSPSIRLEGFDIARGNVKRGERLALLLYWRAQGEIDADYTVFAHLTDASGRVVASVDSPPRGGSAPTSQWRAHQLVIDALTIPIEANMPAGKDYRLQFGLYDSSTQQRLGNVLTIQPINVLE